MLFDDPYDDEEGDGPKSGEILDAIRGMDRYLKAAGRIFKELRRENLTDEDIIELAELAVTELQSPAPLIFISLASRLPIDIDKGLASSIILGLPDDEYWILDDSKESSWDIRPALENLRLINPPGFLEYLITSACLVAVLTNGPDMLATIQDCIEQTCIDEVHRKNLVSIIQHLRNAPQDDIAFHLEKLQNYEF